MTKGKNKSVLIFAFITMLLIAVVDNIKGVLVPAFKTSFSINNSQVGDIFFIGSIAYVLFTYLGGILCEKLGQKKTYGLGFIIIIFSSLLFYISKTYLMFLICIFILNIGIALVAISVNTLVPMISIGFQALAMNLTHFCYGAGSTITQLTTGIVLSKGVSWRNIYLFISVLFLLAFIMFIFIKIPKNNIQDNIDNVKNYKIKDALKEKLFYYYSFALGFYVFAEVATANWLVNFLQESYKFDYKMSSIYLSVFFILLTLGRLFGGFIVEKVGHLKSVIIALFIALILYTISLIIGGKFIFLICISGLFFSIVFPTVVSTIGINFRENSIYMSGIIITTSSIINMILNKFMGNLSDLIGTHKAFYMVPISLIIAIIFSIITYKNTRKNRKTLV
ncbi:MFS transporter [Clostridium ihumii]|uniref:MFS transporter n=1 Tax=Clostridium ihumii TaxID=1470356 RepID=UPI0006853CF6|nr:MFS transporter [Clostridium ihumii]